MCWVSQAESILRTAEVSVLANKHSGSTTESSCLNPQRGVYVAVGVAVGHVAGGLLCHRDAGRPPVPAAGHGLRHHQDQGHRQEGQRRRVVPCGLPEGRTIR